MNQTIYKYITEHLDEDGCFTSFTLCDEPHQTIPRPLGTEDAYYYTLENPSNPKPASLLVKKLRAYLQEPLPQNRIALYKALKGLIFAEYCDSFIDSFGKDDMNIIAYDLARRFFYNAEGREQVKFAYLLLGLYGMEQIKNADPELWQNLVLVAHCEEFTFPFLYSCRIAGYTPQKEIWELLGCTKGWGKIFAIADCHCHNEAERLWLLKNGPDINVEYPPISVKLITETHLEEHLQQELDYSTYKSVMTIIGNYLIMISHFSAENIVENFNTASINLYSLLTKLLQQAKRIITRPEDLLDILTIAITLRNMREENNMYQLTPNECQLLSAACDELIYATDWSEDIAERLIQNDKINYLLCDFAYEMDMDIWPMLMEFFEEHPLEIGLFPYLLAFEGGGRSDKVLRIIIENINLYSSEQNALMVPLRYLLNHPGEGEAIVCAALNSLYDLPRGIACSVVTEWGPAYLTPVLKAALINARHLSNNVVVTAQIDGLLEGQPLSGNNLPEVH